MGNRDDLLDSSQLHNDEPYSIIRNREVLNDGYNLNRVPRVSNYGESSDDYYGVASDSDVIINERYKNDAKLRKLCTVVITPTKEVIEYVRKRDEMYNEILQKQRRKLELRTLEKQREKERRQRPQTILNNGEATAAVYDKANMSGTTNYSEISMSSESEYETSFQIRTRKQRQQNIKEFEPLNIQIGMSEATTTLLSQIELHLDKPASEKLHQSEAKQQQKEDHPSNNDINQQTCDIISDKGQTKMRELNLLADIAQHLSPYQLDLSENNPPRTASPAPAPAPELLQLPPPQPQTPTDKEVPKDKVTITEQLIIQSFDNLLDKRNSHLGNDEHQQEDSNNYAHEPKVNTAAIFKSSPCASLMQQQQNNTQLETNDKNLQNNSTGKEVNPKTQADETLEQILEESISVLKSVTSPYNSLTEATLIRPQINSDCTIPILISNVESLNKNERKSEEKVDSKNSESIVLTENELLNKEMNEKTKDVIEEHNRRNEPYSVLSTNILNNVESSIMCAGDLASIHDETAITQTLKVPSIMGADLSDISLESEISKHLSEIAEPSPIVTDMSDNSNASNVSKSFGFHVSINTNSSAHVAHSNEISVPDLSLVMQNISQATTPPINQSLESGFNQLNCSLNTPTKLPLASNTTNELNTPLKFAIQTELESDNMPLKSTLEPETDNNVTKFLDLILNKTVTDAESERQDEIIKELNALTADTAVVSDAHENSCNNEIMTSESGLNEDKRDKSVVEEEKTLEENTLKENSIDLKPQTNLTTQNNNSHQTLEFSSSSQIEKISSEIEIGVSRDTLKEQNRSQALSANNELNPPKEKLRDDADLPSDSGKIKSPAFNIRCRVRLKRLNMDQHSKSHKKESWIAIPVTKPVEPVSANSDTTNCDTVTTKTILTIKKPCLKTYNKHTSKELLDRVTDNFADVTTTPDVMPTKKPKLEGEKSIPIDSKQTLTSQQLPMQTLTQPSQASATVLYNSTPTTKAKTKTTKTVTFDLSNLTEELRANAVSHHKQKSKCHGGGIAAGALVSRSTRKLPENTLRAAETLQLFVNTINDSARTPPSAEYNKKRTPIKNKCIAEDETPRPPPASTLMGTPPCKKICPEKLRTQITTSKCKDQLVSSLGTPPISSITSDITTARIYTSSPLDQTLPEYDDNVDTVADSELILPTTSGSLRRKLKRPKKSLSRPEPTDDISTDGINNQQECNGEDDTDAVVDNEDDVFAEELLPIPAANEHILEEIVSARPSHIGTGTVIRDDYMNIEATATVPVYLFNDESRDLGSPELIQSSDNTSVVDSSSYLNTSASTITNNVVAAPPSSTTSVIGNLEKSMLSPSEHEVSSTQETFYQTPNKNKQTEIFGEKSSTSKEKVSGNTAFMTTNSISTKQKSEENSSNHKEEYQTSSNIGLLQNNQVDTTNHSPEMCTLALTATTATTTTLTSNRKIRKASTHDEILFNELQQQQLPSNKRKSNTSTICVESTSDNNKSNSVNKPKIVSNNLEGIKSNGSLTKVDDKFKKLLKEVCKRDKTQTTNELAVGLACGGNNGGGGGSSPSTTTTIVEEKLSRSKRKKSKSSKSSKTKSHSERSSKIVLKASKLTPHISANPLIITIPKSRLLKPPSTPPTPTESKDQQQHSEFSDILNAKLFLEKDKETVTAAASDAQNSNNPQQQPSHPEQTLSMMKNASTSVSSRSKSSQSSGNIPTEIVNMKPLKTVESNAQEVSRNTYSTTTPKEKSFPSDLTTKRKEKLKTSSPITMCTNSYNNNLIFVKDKYDLIKSKEKHHHHHYQHDQQDNKEKSKDKTNSQTKSTTSNNTRLHKSSSKEKIKGEKVKEKYKDSKKTTSNHPTDVLKSYTSQNNTKLSTSSPSTALFSSNNTKKSNSKSSKNNSSSASSCPSLSSSAILKSKTNLSTPQSGTAAAATASSQINTTATPSTNNVRKKLKIK